MFLVISNIAIERKNVLFTGGGIYKFSPHIITSYSLRLSQYVEAVFPKDKEQINTIIVTSEDSKRVKEVQEFGRRNGFNVVFNHFDVMQGTGSANDLKTHTNTTNFDVMVISY